jgi:hypothetical protein
VPRGRREETDARDAPVAGIQFVYESIWQRRATAQEGLPVYIHVGRQLFNRLDGVVWVE